jgi:hypothetical protein
VGVTYCPTLGLHLQNEKVFHRLVCLLEFIISSVSGPYWQLTNARPPMIRKHTIWMHIAYRRKQTVVDDILTYVSRFWITFTGRKLDDIQEEPTFKRISPLRPRSSGFSAIEQLTDRLICSYPKAQHDYSNKIDGIGAGFSFRPFRILRRILRSIGRG